VNAATWIVRLPLTAGRVCTYGPINDEDDAARFAAYLTATTGLAATVEPLPSSPEPLRSPLADLLDWFEQSRGER
jgi:hypothetical protein